MRSMGSDALLQAGRQRRLPLQRGSSSRSEESRLPSPTLNAPATTRPLPWL